MKRNSGLQGKPRWRLSTLVTILALLALSPHRSSAETDLHAFSKPEPVDLTKLISSEPVSEEVRIERADAADPYRTPGEGVIVNPWNIDGVNHALITVTPFPNFSLIPSFLRQDIGKPGAYSATFSPCFSETQNDCIDEFSVVREGQLIYAKPFAEIPDAKVLHSVFNLMFTASYKDSFGPFMGDKSKGFPSGGRPWLWKFEGDEKLYVAIVNFTGDLSPTVSKESPWLKYPKVQLQIVPVDIERPICVDPKVGGCTWSNYQYGKDGAIFSNDDISLKRSLFSTTGTFELAFRTTVPWNSWMVGTVTDLNLSFSHEGSLYRYRVSGKPSRISSARKSVKLTEENYRELVELSGGSSAGAADCPKSPECSPFINLGGVAIATSDTFERLERVEVLTDRKSTHSVNAWLLTSAIALGGNDERLPAVMKCVSSADLDYPAGASASNATIFEQAPPLWDNVERTFTYRVGAFHLRSDGSREEGDYSFLISKEVAQCLWGKGVSPSNIQVEIINGDIVSTVISSVSQGETSWIRFRASGFHFSSPKFVMRKRDDLPASAQLPNLETSTTAEGQEVVVKRVVSTIKCVKGKATKRVSGINPKCPKGFKKK